MRRAIHTLALSAALAAAGCATVPAPVEVPAAIPVLKPEPFPAELAPAPPPALPPELRSRGLPEKAADLDGARYVGRTDLSDGGFLVVFYEVRGGTVLYSAYSSYAGAAARETKLYELRDGRFYIRGDAGWCNAIVNTGDCGLLGTVAEDGISFVRYAGGKPSNNQNSYPSQSVAPVPRQK